MCVALRPIILACFVLIIQLFVFWYLSFQTATGLCKVSTWDCWLTCSVTLPGWRKWRQPYLKCLNHSSLGSLLHSSITEVFTLVHVITNLALFATSRLLVYPIIVQQDALPLEIHSFMTKHIISYAEKKKNPIHVITTLTANTQVMRNWKNHDWYFKQGCCQHRWCFLSRKSEEITWHTTTCYLSKWAYSSFWLDQFAQGFSGYGERMSSTWTEPLNFSRFSPESHTTWSSIWCVQLHFPRRWNPFSAGLPSTLADTARLTMSTVTCL